MSIESRWHQYGTVFDHWQKGERLYVSDKRGVAVFRLQHKESSQEESAVKVITLIEAYGKLSEYSPERKAEYETALEERKTAALKEVQFMYALKGYTNIVSYEDRITEHWTESDRFGCDLLIRMELLQDLRKIIRDGRVFPESEIIQIGKDICTALILCHSGKNPIIHRDIKPENIFVNSRGIYKLGDFGISRILDKCQGATATTAIGTEEYIAPEQVQKKYDERVDIYSLGLVLYELSNQNRLPFVETRYPSQYDIQKNLALRMAGNKLPAPSNASAAFAKVILKACAFKAEDRYQTAKEMFAALDKLTDSTPSCASESVDPSATSISQIFETVPAVATRGDRNAFATVPAIPSASEVDAKKGQPQLLTADENKTDLQARADSGDAAAQNEIGCIYYNGRGVSIDYEKAFRWFQKAADRGYVHGQHNLGLCYEHGKGIEKDMSMAKAWYQKAAGQGSASAQYRLGEIYYRGDGVPKAYVQAFKFFQQSAERDYASALDRMGDCFYWGNGTEKSYAKAVEWYQKAADKGNASAMYSLGFCYKHGQGVDEDKKKAALLFYEAAQKGSSAAQKELDTIEPNESLHLADCLYYGRDVDKNRTNAIPYFLKAAEAGSRYAEYSLGYCYENGHGVKTDFSEAFSWYQKAAKHGNVESMRHLANCYLYGKGVNKDASTAVVWYVKAAESDDAVALRQLGVCYADGLGIQMDLLKAMDYYQKAMEKSDLEAAIQYDRILTDASKSEKAELNACGHRLENIPKKHAEEIAKQKKAEKKKKTKDILSTAGYVLPLLALIAGCVMWFVSIPIWINITALSVMGIATGIVARAMLCTIGKKKGFKLRPLAYPVFCVAGAIGVPLVTAIVIAIIEGILWFCG